MTRTPILTTGVMALALLAAPLAAQEQTPEQPAEITAESVTDAQVEAFVKAAIAVESLRKEYMTRIGNAESEEDANKLKAEANNVAIQLVDKARGITAQEYLAISGVAQKSPELTERIQAQVEVMRAQKAEFEKRQAEAAKAKEAQRAAEAQKAAEDTKAETDGTDADTDTGAATTE